MVTGLTAGAVVDRWPGSRALGWEEGLAWLCSCPEGTHFPCSRSGRRLKKTRKYDIITTPAERVEMAPLNEEDDEEEDATVFDIKYR